MNVRSFAAASCAAFLAAGANAGAQTTTRVSIRSSGTQGDQDSFGWTPAIAADGQTVAFNSLASNLVDRDTNLMWDVFVHDGAATECVSLDPNGLQGNGASYGATLSSDGRIVAFLSNATNLVPGLPWTGVQVYVHDRDSSTTELASVDSSGVQADRSSMMSSISGNGRFVAFSSHATNLVSGDTNARLDVFVHDRATGATERVSVDSSGVEGDDESDAPALSADGRFVVFQSLATNLVASDGNGVQDVFVRDRATGTTWRASVDSAGGEADGASSFPAISADGASIAFISRATNLVANDTKGYLDVFVHDLASGATERVSVDSAGNQGNADARDDTPPSIGRGGRLVAFASLAANLVAADTNRVIDVFVHDRATGATTRESVDSSGAEANDWSEVPSLSDDGESLSFTSYATNLVKGDTNGKGDVFLRRRCQALATGYGAGLAGTNGVPSLAASADPVLGTTVDVDLGSSLGATTPGLLLAGLQQAAAPFKGGTLLVVDLFALVPLSVPAGGIALPFSVPGDPALCGFSFYLQALEVDVGAPRGISMTPGLFLTLGY